VGCIFNFAHSFKCKRAMINFKKGTRLIIMWVMAYVNATVHNKFADNVQKITQALSPGSPFPSLAACGDRQKERRERYLFLRDECT
jgi:hypothetical protein